ncbi:insulin-like growth factor binding protein [Mycena filopes]|nr:insulin-like growth factor binding protein [Mycena filopes]
MVMSGEPSAVGPPSSANRLPSSYKNQNQYNLRVVNELGGFFGPDAPNLKLQLRVVSVTLWTPWPTIQIQLPWPWHSLMMGKISIGRGYIDIDIPSFRFTILQQNSRSTSLFKQTGASFEFFNNPSSDGNTTTLDGDTCSCATYSESTSSDCLTCASPQYLTGFNQSCPDCTFVDGSACSSCDTSCATCSGFGTCLTCPSTSYFDAGECVPTCPDGTTSLNGDTCDACDSSCTTASDCSTCAPTLQYFTGLNQCVDTCPDGTFVDGAVCSSCDSSCATRTTSSSTACLTCSSDFHKFDSVVERVGTCPDGTTMNGGAYPRFSDTCNAFDSSCATCSGSTSNDCSTCAPTQYHTGSNQCVDTCPSGTFVKGTACSSDSSCATCSGSGTDTCLTCSSDFHFDSGECVPRATTRTPGYDVFTSVYMTVSFARFRFPFCII